MAPNLIIQPENVFRSSGDPDDTIHYIIETDEDDGWERHCVLRRANNPKLFDKLEEIYEEHRRGR